MKIKILKSLNLIPTFASNPFFVDCLGYLIGVENLKVFFDDLIKSFLKKVNSIVSGIMRFPICFEAYYYLDECEQLNDFEEVFQKLVYCLKKILLKINLVIYEIL